MTVHIVGAGLAGLSCAVRLEAKGTDVVLYEALRDAGGRCRSISRRADGQRIECGIHLMLSHQHAALAYLNETGARDTLVQTPRSGVRFVDLHDGVHWNLRPSLGHIPWWTMIPGRTVPGSGMRDWIAMMRVAIAGPYTTMGEIVPNAPVSRRRLWAPSIVAALNTTAERGLARDYWAVVRASLFGGAEASAVLYARDDLSTTFVDPALRLLDRSNVDVRFGQRLAALETIDGRVSRLSFEFDDVALERDDAVVLAVPHHNAAKFVDDPAMPCGSSAIVTLTYFLERPLPSANLGPILALVDERTDWLLLRDDRIVVTIGAADDLVEADQLALARDVWQRLSTALNIRDLPLPDWCIMPFVDGTFAQTRKNVGRRPGTATRYNNLFLAGDWTDTGYPASIESAVRSGHKAAEFVARLCQAKKSGARILE